ncbi:group II intron reverse transcriptase/maturase [Mycobacterium heckeshornense]|uniref:group II intron reverse transcriptase/maturase n=1 Tax=Mycobacterium TaxID=1763 RepID=UPI000704C3D1|nr:MULTISPECIES: group II intron reverse transcriptase/maturase [Mycobacterium]MCV7036890.1 group II intron reverse transcriptase/maturase [Mycobacterium heckeshornense]
MSALVASPTLGVGGDVLDPVRALQRKLYRAAKADPGRRFHALYDKVHRRDVLGRAWVKVWRNGGAPGVDHQTIADVEEYGVTRLLNELEVELREGSFRPLPARRVYIPKPGQTERRPLSIPAVRDRVVQAAVKIVLEPVFEADMMPCSFGFRPKRSAHDALQVLIDESFGGKRWIVETDIANCFTAIPHDGLMSAVEERICDRKILALLRAFLRAGVMEEGAIRREVSGTAQGGVISPMLCNVYLGRLDRAWRPAYGRLVRYADDLVAVCRSRGQAEAALVKLTALLRGLGLEPKQSKTRIVQLVEGQPGFDFLGFHHRLVRSLPRRGASGYVFLARWPSEKAMRHARARIRFLTKRARLVAPVEQVVAEVNLFLRGWAGYFRFGNSAWAFDKTRQYAQLRIALFVAKRHQRGRSWGFHQIYRSPADLGLASLNGIIVAPRANKPWRDRPNAGGEGCR